VKDDWRALKISPEREGPVICSEETLTLSTAIQFNSTLDPVDFQAVPHVIFRSLQMLYCELPPECLHQPHTKQRTNKLRVRLCLEHVWSLLRTL